MDETGANSRLDTPEFRETLQFYSDLILKNKVSPPISDPANDSKPVDDFYAGTVALMNSGPWDFINARTRAKFNWDVTLFPKGKAGNYTNVQGSGFTVSSKSKYKQEAYQALTVITGTEGLSVLAKSGRAFPARASAVPAFYDTTRAPANAKIIEKASTTVQRYRVTPTWFDVLPIMNKEIDNVLIGQKTVDQFVKEVNPQFQDLLTKAVALSKLDIQLLLARADLGVRALENRDVEVLLAPEVVVDHAFGGARLVGDVVHPGARIAALGEFARGDVEDVGARPPRVAAPTLSLDGDVAATQYVIDAHDSPGLSRGLPN